MCKKSDHFIFYPKVKKVGNYYSITKEEMYLLMFLMENCLIVVEHQSNINILLIK